MQISFSGQLSGDGECFCWDNIPPEDVDKIITLVYNNIKYEDENHKQNLQEYYEEDRRKNNLCPHDIWSALGLEYGKNYKFTISAEEV